MSPKLNIYDPVNIREGVYYSKLTVEDGDINLQVKKNNLKIDPENNKAILDIDSKTAEYINWLSKEIVSQTADNSEKWFGKTISVEDCETIYKNALVDGVRLHCFYDENTRFYENKTTEINHEELTVNMSGIAMIKSAVIIFTKNSFFVRWEISQFKVKNSEKPQKLVEYSIRDLDEHNTSFDIDSKIKNISLF